MHMRVHSTHLQSGSSLMEILIAIVITVIGLLGIAGLQINALKYQQTSSQRSEAMQSAYDMADRMRANRVASTATVANPYQYVTAYATTVASPPVRPVCAGICTNAAVAADDQADWLLNLSRRLVGGAGYITPRPGGVFGLDWDVTVMWREPGFAGVDATCPGAAPAPGAGVRCYVVSFRI